MLFVIFLSCDYIYDMLLFKTNPGTWELFADMFAGGTIFSALKYY